MNPSTSFCPHSDCVMRGLQDQGNVIIHSRQEQRYQCTCCGHTFAATSGTPYYRLRSPRQLVEWVVSLLAHGCPLQAIVVTFGLDERTVAAWQQRAGEHCQQVHAATVQQGQLDLQHVQADELWVKAVGRRFWMALALDAVTRLWLGGAVQTTRDGALIENVVQQVRRCARSLGLLVCVDGLSSYVTAFRRALREPFRTGGAGRPRLLPAPGFLLGQVIKRCVKRRLVEVIHRPVVGTLAEIETRLRETSTGQGIHTAYIERLNATFRSRVPPGRGGADAAGSAVGSEGHNAASRDGAGRECV